MFSLRTRAVSKAIYIIDYLAENWLIFAILTFRVQNFFAGRTPRFFFINFMFKIYSLALSLENKQKTLSQIDIVCLDFLNILPENEIAGRQTRFDRETTCIKILKHLILDVFQRF